jgi:hypothetical protein
MRGDETNPSRPAYAQWGATGTEHAGTITSTPENASFPDEASEFYYDLPGLVAVVLWVGLAVLALRAK